MLEALTELFQAVWQQPIQVAIELLLIAAVIWVLLGYLLRTRAAAVVIPISIFVLLLVVILDLLSSASDAFARLRAVVDWVIGGSLIALLFAFQPELRQGLMKLDPSRWVRVFTAQWNSFSHRSGDPSSQAGLTHPPGHDRGL